MRLVGLTRACRALDGPETTPTPSHDPKEPARHSARPDASGQPERAREIIPPAKDIAKAGSSALPMATAFLTRTMPAVLPALQCVGLLLPGVEKEAALPQWFLPQNGYGEVHRDSPLMSSFQGRPNGPAHIWRRSREDFVFFHP